jgi:hypothetical protein
MKSLKKGGAMRIFGLFGSAPCKVMPSAFGGTNIFFNFAHSLLLINGDFFSLIKKQTKN